MGVTEGVGVVVSVGKEADIAVTVSMTDVSIELTGGKFESGLDTPRLHALSRNIAVVTKSIKKFFLIRIGCLYS
jgi:hypothetical protein